MNIIYLVKRGGVWCCQFAGPHAVQVRRLFGTDCLPSADRDSAPYAEVARVIAINNPGCHVREVEAINA